MRPVEQFHECYVHNRRVRVLSRRIADLISPSARVLDVGCGDGLLAFMVMRDRPDITITGLDVLVREKTHIPVGRYDGQALPHPDNSFDAVMLVDVLHHTDNPLVLLREAVRVAQEAIIIKDHTCEGLFADATLRFMDRVGNARHGVALPYNYWTQQRWFDAFASLRLGVSVWCKSLQIYPGPASWIFDRSLQFLARLDICPAQPSPSRGEAYASPEARPASIVCPPPHHGADAANSQGSCVHPVTEN
jgi:SAM-dependent methyltransferase